VRLITVHGRTRCQFYKGHARWGLVRATVEATALPVVVNGDIASLADARQALAQSGAAAVMIGRAALGRPWLAGEISAGLRNRPFSPPKPADMADSATRHYDFLLSAMGRETGLRHARKHVAAYMEEAARLGSPIAGALRERLCRSDDPDAVLAGLAEAFAAVDLRRAA
jgi:tRNA-dihydrouridine synthase B